MIYAKKQKNSIKNFKQCELTDDEVDKLLRVELLPKNKQQYLQEGGRCCFERTS